MKFVNLGPHSWGCVGGGDDVLHSYGANQGFVAGGDACLVVDSGFHNGTARRVLGRVLKFRPEKMLLVDTHYHSDHVFGNNVFARDGAAVISHQKCRRRMMTLSPKLLADYRGRDPRLSRLLKGVHVSLPSVTFQDRLWAHLDDEVGVEVVHPGVRAHTDGDSMVFVPRDRVVFAGDVLWVGYHPNLEDSDIQGQIRALRMILRFRPRKVVPGHGQVCGLGEVKQFIRYLEELNRNVRQGLKERLGPEELVAQAIPAWSRDWKMKRLAESYIRKIAGRN